MTAAYPQESGDLYAAMVTYLVGHGWRREDDGSGWWWRDGFTEGIIGDAVQQQLEKDGIDFRDAIGQGAVVAAWSDGLGADDIAILNMDHSDECEHAWKFVCIVGNAPAYRCEQCRAEKHD